jgi:metal-sulfur cluster biosynthetic enzyme/Fe-S cluster assembly iron-binding protein IscA
MAETRAASTDRPVVARPEALGITATPEAERQLAAHLATLPAGQGVRVWVETGIRPQVKMMFDRPTPRDRIETVGSVPVYVDSLSERFLIGARIELVRSGGQEGFHVSGPNVPGAPIPSGAPAAPGTSSGTPERSALEEKIRTALKSIYDPEIPMNLVDLGLIYGIDWRSDQAVTLRMTLTSIGCPSTEQICEEVDRAVRGATGLSDVKVEVVWQPPWTPDRMSEFAKRQFGYL